MNAKEFIQSSIQGLHETPIEDMDMKDLSPKQMAWRPQPGANPIGHIFLHYMRTEDTLVRRIAGCPSLWDTEKRFEKCNTAFGSIGVSASERRAELPARLPLADSLAYAQQVMGSTREFLSTLDDSKLDANPRP